MIIAGHKIKSRLTIIYEAAFTKILGKVKPPDLL